MSRSAEEAILTAVLDEDYGRARELLADFLPGELFQLENAVCILEDLIGEVQRERRAQT